MAIPSDYQVKVNTTTGAAASTSNNASNATNPNDVSVYGTNIVNDPSTSAAKNTGATSSSQAQVLAMVTQLVSGISQLTDANSNTLASSYKSQYDLIKSMAGDIDVDSLVRQQMQGMADNQKEKVSQILGVSQSNNTNAANNTNNAFGSMMGSSSNPLDSFSNMVGNLITQKLAQAFGGSNSSSSKNNNVPTQNSSNIQTGATASDLAKVAEQTAESEGTVGKCLKGVNDTLEKVYGFRCSFEGAYQAADALAEKTDKFKEVKVGDSDLSSLPAGAIVVWDKSSSHPYGHISVALGDGREASDHVQNQCHNLTDSFRVFIPNC